MLNSRPAQRKWKRRGCNRFRFDVIIIGLFVISFVVAAFIVWPFFSSEERWVEKTEGKHVALFHRVPRPLWKVLLEVQHAMNDTRAKIDQFADTAVRLLQQVPNATVPNRECMYANSAMKQFRWINMLNSSQRWAPFASRTSFDTLPMQDNGSFFQFTEALPLAVGQVPIVLSEAFDITKPFGHWKAVFIDISSVEAHALVSSTTTGGVMVQSSTGIPNAWRFIIPPPTPPMFAMIFSNAMVSTGRVVTCNGNVYSAGGCPRDRHPPVIQKGGQPDKYAIVVPLCSMWCGAYFHFTHEELVRLALVYRILVEREDAVLVLSTSMKRFHMQWLSDILGIPPSRILYNNPFVHGRIVLYPMPSRCGSVSVHMLYVMRAIVFDRLGLVAQPSVEPRKLRLFFAERERLSRMPSNYYALKRMLMAEYDTVFSFSSASPKLHVSEQVRAFYHADVVVGPHGANLANVIWMRRGTHLVEFGSHKYGNMCYYTAANHVNVTHHIIFHSGGKDEQYTLAYSYLKRHIDRAIKDLRAAR